MTERREVLKKAVEFLRTFEPPPDARKPDMKRFRHLCGSPSCAAGWLYSEGIAVCTALGYMGFVAVFGPKKGYRRAALDRLGIDMSTGAQTGEQALRDAADRLEAVMLLGDGDE